jgi:hypothetical protein
MLRFLLQACFEILNIRQFTLAIFAAILGAIFVF